MFKFPTDEALKKEWIARVPCINWTPTDNSRLCEKHFFPCYFQEEREDKSCGRSIKRELIKKRSKHDTIPIVWPNLPGHLSKVKSPRLTKLAKPSSRQIIQDERNRGERIMGPIKIFIQ